MIYDYPWPWRGRSTRVEQDCWWMSLDVSKLPLPSTCGETDIKSLFLQNSTAGRRRQAKSTRLGFVPPSWLGSTWWVDSQIYNQPISGLSGGMRSTDCHSSNNAELVLHIFACDEVTLLAHEGRPAGETRSSADADNRLDAFSGQSRSTNMVPFHMLYMVSYCAIVTLSLRHAVFTIFVFKKFHDLEINGGQRSLKVIESGIIW